MKQKEIAQHITRMVEEHFDGYSQTGIAGYTVRRNPETISFKAANPEKTVQQLRDAGIIAGVCDTAFDEVEVAIECEEELEFWLNANADTL